MRNALWACLLVACVALLPACSREETPEPESTEGGAKTEGKAGTVKAEGDLSKLPPGAAKAIESTQDGKIKVTSGKGELVIKEPDGTGKVALTPDGGKLPKGFPKDVPVYKGATILGAIQKDKGHTLILNSKDAPDTVLATYDKVLKAQGWLPQEATPNTLMLAYRKGERACVIVTTHGEGVCHINVTTDEE